MKYNGDYVEKYKINVDYFACNKSCIFLMSSFF